MALASGAGRDARGEHPLSGHRGDAAAAPEVAAAAAALAGGGLVAFPTETVYGLGADAERPEAVARIFAAKGRPDWHPLIVHGADAELLHRYGRAPSAAARRLAELWPAPLTIVVARTPAVPDAVTGGRDTVGLRVPDQPVALALLAAFGRGVAAPSANRFGRVSPTSAADVRAELGDAVSIVLDGGRSRIGVESTIVDCTGPRATILRRGAVTAQMLAETLGDVVEDDLGPARAPGMLAAHYRPSATVELTTLDALGPRAETLLDAGRRVAVMGAVHGARLPEGVLLLASPDSAADYAHELYAQLRAADVAGVDVVLAVPPAPVGIGAAVADRLRRASDGD